MKKIIVLSLILLSISAGAYSQRGKQSFTLGDSEFLLDGKPFQIISSELHPARIPAPYWRDRIKLAKSLGSNTITIALFWNYYETDENVFDFETGNRNIAEFIRLVQEEELFLIIKPGPYISVGWENGGLPYYLDYTGDVKFRTTDAAFMAAVNRYFDKLSEILKPMQVSNGGPLLMLQIEDEYGSFGSDKNYLQSLAKLWKNLGFEIPTFTSEIPSVATIKAGTIPGSAIGLKYGCKPSDFEMAASISPGVPVFACLIATDKPFHWGDKRTKIDSLGILNDVKYLLDNKKSFNIILQGGTNYGYTSGAELGNNGFEPYITSYDNNELATEDGKPTEIFRDLRKLINSYQGKKATDIPKSMESLEITPLFLQPFASVWDNLPVAVASELPLTFESLKQGNGFVLYRTTLPDTAGGVLILKGVHDYATIFVNEKYIGHINRMENNDNDTIIIPATTKKATLEILVESMGKVVLAEGQDKKGLTGAVLFNEKQLKGWSMYALPLSEKFVYDLRSGRTLNKPGIFFKGNFMIASSSGIEKADTYIDVSNFSKGILWINGHNLGRFWNIGPQKRLYCPASWIREGLNEFVLFDLHETKARMVSGYTSEH
ncbi:MAG TPA: beta-galactosidase [Bacteroidales bacterium]|nr:beta-galactosidase [Bacteroidales bacterium]